MFPAQALAEEMLSHGWRVTLTTDARGARYAGGFPDAVERRATAAATFAQGSAMERVAAPFAIAAGTAGTLMAMRRDRPSVVAGFGGYPALPAMLAAGALKIPRLIHEQNGVLGRVNRRFAPRVEVVACGTWPTALPAGARGLHVGNPVRTAVLAQLDAPYIEPGDWPMGLVVIGGSQGAGFFGRIVPEAMRHLDPRLAGAAAAQRSRCGPRTWTGCGRPTRICGMTPGPARLLRGRAGAAGRGEPRDQPGRARARSPTSRRSGGRRSSCPTRTRPTTIRRRTRRASSRPAARSCSARTS